MIYWVNRVSNRRSIAWEDDVAIEPVPGARLLCEDTGYQAFWVMDIPDMPAFLSFVDGLKRDNGKPCQQIILSKTDTMYADDMKALGAEPPEWRISIYDDYAE